jgi:UTP--glucose-1-phosphate uridylyltransferase
MGTRFLPATKATPKEMLPLVDRPAIQYVVEEAAGAGLTDILLVTGSGKSSIEDHFDTAAELERQLDSDGKRELLEATRRPSALGRLHYVRQGTPLGLGHAIGCARDHVGDEIFAVLLGDDIIGADETLLSDMVALAESTGRSVIAVMEFPPEYMDKYGFVKGETDPDDPDVTLVRDLVEKPGAEAAPSNLGMIGHYVLTPDIFDHIDATEPGAGGEIQITDALQAQAHEEPIRAITFRGTRFDVGDKVDWLRACVQLACERDDLGPPFRAFLKDYAATLP